MMKVIGTLLLLGVAAMAVAFAFAAGQESMKVDWGNWMTCREVSVTEREMKLCDAMFSPPGRP